ncbi:MAG: hypothetical protein AAFZ07_20680 [Actinomycetota bacterium]
MRRLLLLLAAATLAAACTGAPDLSAAEERALAVAASDDPLPTGWRLDDAVRAESGDAVPQIEGCDQLAALDVSEAEGFVTASYDAPDAELPLLDLDLDVIVMPATAAAAAYVGAVADPATPDCLIAINDGFAGVAVVDVLAPAVAGGESARLRFDFPPDDEDAAATFELVAMASSDLLAVVEIAYATEVPPPGLDALLASFADRLAAAPS